MFQMYVWIELINVKQMKNSQALLVNLGAHDREIGSRGRQYFPGLTNHNYGHKRAAKLKLHRINIET